MDAGAVEQRTPLKLLAGAAFRFFLDDDLRESSRFRFGNFAVRARYEEARTLLNLI